MQSAYKFIEYHKDVFGIKLMCKALKVPRSSYYKYINKTTSKRELENKEFEESILVIYEGSKKRYCAPKIHKLHTQEGTKIRLKEFNG